MRYKSKYITPKQFSNLIMISDGEYLTELYFEGFRDELDCKEKDLLIFKEVSKWLDIYFSGRIPLFTPKYRIDNLTPFRKEVLDIVSSIKYGELLTYGDIAKTIASNRHIKKMSSQAVGQAVGWNPICLIVPCHRVVGVSGNLTGYSSGINNKLELLKLEGIDMSKYFIPNKKSID